jgi:hypothetical protein
MNKNRKCTNLDKVCINKKANKKMGGGEIKGRHGKRKRGNTSIDFEFFFLFLLLNFQKKKLQKKNLFFFCFFLSLIEM